MRTTTAYFAGAGTIVIAIAAGLGGGLVIANMVAPHSPKGAEMSKFERRISEPIPVSNAPSEPVPYLAATQAAAQPADLQSARNSNSSAQHPLRPTTPSPRRATPI
jgi:hypothetical protein